MDMQALLAEIELDMQELKYLTEAFMRESNDLSRGVLRRNILQMRSRLDEMFRLVDAAVRNVETNKSVELQEVIETVQSVELPLREDISAFVIEEQVIEVEQKNEVETKGEESGTGEKEVKIEKKEELVSVTITSSPILGDRIKLAGDLRHAISLNDSFRFSREIFNDDSGLMNRVLEQISAMGSMETALAFLSTKVIVDEENEATIDFLELLKKHFN